MIFSRKNRTKNLKEYSDEALVALYQKTKGQACFGEIYRRYSHIVHGACLKYLKEPHLAQDTMMDIFEALMKKIPEQKEIRSLDGWLFQVTRNECFSRLRKTKKLRIESLDEEKNKNKAESFMENEDILRLIDEDVSEPLEQTVNDAINQLKPEQKACIIAFYLENKSYKEIEKELGYPLVKVKSYIQNGKRNLKPLLLTTQTRN